MGKVNDFLSKRLSTKPQSQKATQLAKASANGQLSSFTGIFSIQELSEGEKNEIESILLNYSKTKASHSKDLNELLSISAEVKAINNQAALLHGERIKKAQAILKKYQEGAFTAWLVTTYGNRQTPYNFLQYFEFCSALPNTLRPKIEEMPRQAIYTLASREGSSKEKEEVVRSYSGESKEQVLQIIRERFPLALTDQRRQKVGESVIRQLQKISGQLERTTKRITKRQKEQILCLLEEIEGFIE